jgi:TonB family protein
MKTLISGLVAAALLVSSANAQDHVFADVRYQGDVQIFPDPATAKPPELMIWRPGEVRCGGQPVAAVAMARPFIGFSTEPRREAIEERFRFRIDADGRPLSIVQDGMSPWSRGVADSLGALLAVSRFAAGPTRSDCTIAFVVHPAPIDTAAAGDLMAYTMLPFGIRLPPAAWKRMASAGSTCLDTPRPAPLLRAFPDFDALPGTAGVRDWSMVGYDLDAKGRPANVRIVEGTGNRALDAASVEALHGSRFTGGARTGCLYPFWRKAAPMPAPASPDRTSLRPEGANCLGDRPWAVKPRLFYPTAYRQRAIEGWAAVAYDVAPWGDTGNIRVLASEPAAAFGQQATQIIRAARKAPSPNGATGCVEMVRFVTARDDAADDDATGFGQY